MGEAILITSGKGGSGKSTFTVNCGAAMAAIGKKVLLVDTDAGLRSLDLMLSVSGKVVYDLADVLRGNCSPAKAIVKTDVLNLFLLCAPPSPFEENEAKAMVGFVNELKADYDYIFIDSPAGIGASAMMAVSAADLVIIVATPDPVCIRDADRAATAVFSAGATNVRLVINRVVPKRIRNKIIDNLDIVIDGTAIRLIGLVPEDEKIVVSNSQGRLLKSGRKGAAAAYKNIAYRIMGQEVSLLKL